MQIHRDSAETGGCLELGAGLERNGESLLMGSEVLLGNKNGLMSIMVTEAQLYEYTKTH